MVKISYIYGEPDYYIYGENFVTFMVDFYYIYNGYYICGWLLHNSQHCCANNVGSCCVRVGSAVQTDATTPNNVGICSASWEGYNP